jgi:D-arabinose 1-dehydrogenase-like Zn-dependent alcohol dehydrogenase
VTAIDHASKESLCTESGAEVFLNFTKYTNAELASAVKAVTGRRGAHVAIVINAANRAYEQSLNFLKPNGTLVCIGVPEGKPESLSRVTYGQIPESALFFRSTLPPLKQHRHRRDRPHKTRGFSLSCDL